jgi:hypothetical protein
VRCQEPTGTGGAKDRLMQEPIAAYADQICGYSEFGALRLHEAIPP